MYDQCPAPSTWVNWFPDREDVDGFYNSVCVAESTDGTFFMTNGFSVGYMGLQDKSPKWVIFSCWDQPGCPVEVVEQGPLTQTDCFGGEGTGGKSWIEFDWQAGVRYSMCVTSRAGAAGKTIYSGYFMHPQRGWTLVASMQTRHPNDGRFLKGLGSFEEDWLSNDKKGGILRASHLGPALVHYAGAGEDWHSCGRCRGASQDTRQPAGYLNREVKCIERSLLVGVCTGGMNDLLPDLYDGPLQTHIVPSPSISLAGSGKFAGEYCAGGAFINGEIFYHCIKLGTFIAFDGDVWQLASTHYLQEIVDKQGKFGSLDHSTNGGRITEARWADYTIIPINLPAGSKAMCDDDN